MYHINGLKGLHGWQVADATVFPRKSVLPFEQIVRQLTVLQYPPLLFNVIIRLSSGLQSKERLPVFYF
jgi:hypothetical protein